MLSKGSVCLISQGHGEPHARSHAADPSAESKPSHLGQANSVILESEYLKYYEESQERQNHSRKYIGRQQNEK